MLAAGGFFGPMKIGLFCKMQQKQKFSLHESRDQQQDVATGGNQEDDNRK